MKKVSEYLQHARECREMKRTFNPGSRQQLEEMAEAWEQMAEARRRQLRKQGDELDDQVLELPLAAIGESMFADLLALSEQSDRTCLCPLLE